MKSRILYIELKTGYTGNGPAWIGKVEFSKSGQTVYFNNTALKKMKAPGISGNHYNIENGDEYWVSGVKKNGKDRHWIGVGKIFIDNESIEEYLEEVGVAKLDPNKFDIIEFVKTDKSRFGEIENEILEIVDTSYLDKRLEDMNENELRERIDYYYSIEQNIGPNKARKDYRKLRNMAEEELEKRLKNKV